MPAIRSWRLERYRPWQQFMSRFFYRLTECQYPSHHANLHALTIFVISLTGIVPCSKSIAAQSKLEFAIISAESAFATCNQEPMVSWFFFILHNLKNPVISYKHYIPKYQGFVPAMVSENAFAKSKQHLSKESMGSFTEKRFSEANSQLSNTNFYKKK